MVADLNAKIFLVISSNNKKLALIESRIKAHILNPTIYTASDGIQGLRKIANVTPHVIITDLDIPKVSGSKVVNSVLESETLAAVSIIIADPPPEDALYVDELVTGRIHFLNSGSEVEFTHALIESLNFAFEGGNAEFRLKFLAPQDSLIKEGDPAKFVYFVKKGRLRAYRFVDGKRVHLGNIEIGEFVGEMAYVIGGGRTANVEALTDCELIEVPVGTLDRLLYARPSWAKTLMLTLSKRLKQANLEKLKTASRPELESSSKRRTRR